MKRHAISYSLKVWLTTSVVASLIIGLIRFKLLHDYLASAHWHDYRADKQYHKFLLREAHTLLGSVTFTIPLFFGLYYSILFLGKRQVPFHHYKRYLSIIGVLLALLPEFLLLCYSMIMNLGSFYDLTAFSFFGIFYTLAVIASIWFYRLKPNVGGDLQSKIINI